MTAKAGRWRRVSPTSAGFPVVDGCPGVHGLVLLIPLYTPVGGGRQGANLKRKAGKRAGGNGAAKGQAVGVWERKSGRRRWFRPCWPPDCFRALSQACARRLAPTQAVTCVLPNPEVRCPLPWRVEIGVIGGPFCVEIRILFRTSSRRLLRWPWILTWATRRSGGSECS